MIERDIERALVQDVTKLLLELGTGFAFLGNQYCINVGGDDFYIDLLFYNLSLRCYVVIELKTGDFKPEYLNDVKDYWKNKCVLDRWNLMLPEDVKRLRANGAIFIDRKAVRGYGETTVDWRMIVNKGIGAIRDEAKAALEKLDDAVPGDLEKSFFYKAEIMVADAIIHLSHRHADLAEQMAAQCSDKVRKDELLKIAEVCRWVPEHPATY